MVVTIDQLTYHEPKSQTSPESTISSVANKKIVNSLTSVSPGVYKDSSLLGTFPSLPPPPVSDPSSSNVCIMQSSQAALKQPASASQQLRSPQPAPSPSPTVGSHEPLYPPRMVPPSLSHLGAVPPGHYPYGQIPFLTPPPGVYIVPVIATLSLPNLLVIPVWYLDPLAATPRSN